VTGPSNLKAKSAAAAVTDSLRSTILRGAYAGGERLRQDEIAAQFNVSQTIVREAFKELVSESLLIAEPRRGVHVPPLEAEDAKEMTVLRSIVEPQALEWAIPYIHETTITSATRILDAIDKEKSTERLIDLNNEFHMTLYSLSGKSRTIGMVLTLRRSFERYLRFAWDNTPYLHKSQEQHRELLRLCETAKTEEACKLLKRHILSTGEILVARLSPSLS
jgi:DNA-binding GntR family transcriptional regulator